MAPGVYTVVRHGGVAEIRLACGKANALNPRSLAALAAAFDEAAGVAARGVVLTGYDRYFSAGLDLVGLYDFDPSAMDAFVADFDRVMLRIFAEPRPVVAAINGHAIAGGCILALACDARVMADGDGRIGLNEIRLGLPFPAAALEIARHAVPGEHLEAILYGGQLYGPADALTRGLVDGVETGDVAVAAGVVCERLAERPGGAFATIKAGLKGPAIRQAGEMRDVLRAAFVEAWLAPDARALIGEARARLRR
ncbi:MAG TPA: enoyl-CoA hydratase/isomerase family protein [Methylomirabilota bacterium]|jgi:enoyl-CoA hydratase|nr:enoyl-CoA hydratase/isomerase family protein [Methylomirabilota bacterium]